MPQNDDQAKALADFITRHAKPYDPATDGYDRPPFAADIKEGKNDPIYNAHSYHTKVPPRSIIPYILHYSEPGDLVLDLFCGSGMTGVAAQMCAKPPVTAKVARAELADLPVVIPADEDTVVDVPVSVRNSGNCELEFEVRVLNNLGEELLVKRSRLAPATTQKETARVLAKYKEGSDREIDASNTVTGVTLRLRHTDLQGEWRDALDGLVTIPVKVKPKMVKLETDALKSFDDI